MSTCLTLLGISLRSSLTLIKRVAAAVKSQRSGKNYGHIHICLFVSFDTKKSFAVKFHLFDIIMDFTEIISHANKAGCRCCKITMGWEKLPSYFLFVLFDVLNAGSEISQGWKSVVVKCSLV